MSDGLEQFKVINDKMYWKGSALQQILEFEALGGRLGVKIEAVGSHMSKSIVLPVIGIKINGTMFFLRDNFYDINLCVRAESSIHLSYSDLLGGACPEHDWAWYLERIAKCRGYTWDYFTDEEMDDPRVLSVMKPHKHSKDGKAQEWTVSREQKDRWLKRMSSPEWWRRDWSGGTLCWEGEFGPGVKFFVQSHPFMQGIEELVPEKASKPYQPGRSEFALAVRNLEAAEVIIRRVSGLK